MPKITESPQESQPTQSESSGQTGKKQGKTATAPMSVEIHQPGSTQQSYSLRNR